MQQPKPDPRQPHRASSQHLAGERRPSPATQHQVERRNKRALRRKRLTAFGVMLVLILVLMAVALLLTRGQPAPVSSAAPPSVAPSSVPVSQPVASSTPPPEPARTPTPYDEEAMPLLFNFENEVSEDYLVKMELVDVGGGQQMEKRAAAAFIAMADAAKADGLDLVRVSGYRSNLQQTNNYNASIQRYLDQGMTKQRAVEETEGYYAIPGTSEHEAGLAMDIGFILDSFEDTPEFTWLQEHAAEYGFIMRYREEDFATTHIHYEPWHYRYVGANHAEKMAELGITTLEEYVDAQGNTAHVPTESVPASSASGSNSPASVRTGSATG